MAKAIKKMVIREKYFTYITYEYRGYEYDVEYANGWMVAASDPKIQHESAQERIDKMIEDREKEKNQEHKSFDEVLDEVWQMMGW